MAKRKTAKKPLETPPWWPEGFVPCVASDPASVTGGRFARVFMLAPTFDGTLAVQRHPNMPGAIGIRERVIPNAQMKLYTLISDEESALQSHLADLKNQMLAEGASREAVRLVGEYLPFSQKELRIMAEKLQTKKAAGRKAPAKKPAAASTGEKGTGGRKHSLDEAAAITLTEKGEEKLKKNASTGATENLKIMKKAKTIGKALKAGLAPGDVTYAQRTGTIEIG